MNDLELAALEAALTGLPAFDPESLFFSDVSPDELADAIRRSLGGEPYRRGTTSSRIEIAVTFLAAARRVAMADGGISDAEGAVIARFEHALGLGRPGSA